MDDDELLRYSRQIMLPDVGIEGQLKLSEARVLIIGLGGLGCPVALYLAAAGVGTLVLCDDDDVDLTNLQRQILHTTDTIGMAKTASAAQGLAAINPLVRVIEHRQRLDTAALLRATKDADVVVDCSDNFATRFAINATCRQSQTPLVSGAAIRWDGQVAVFDGRPESHCYRCLYDETGDEDLSCANNGVISPLVGIIGTIQALETLKLITSSGVTLGGRLLLLDGLRMNWREVRLQADPDCPVCRS